MPRLFYRVAPRGEWAAAAAFGPGLELRADGSAVPLELGDAGTHHPRLIGDVGGAADVLLVPVSGARPVFVNGHRVLLSMTLLEDQDEIRAGCQRFYYLARDPIEVIPFPDDFPETVACPRCTRAIEPGSPAERCTSGVWFHQACGRAYGPCPCCPEGQTTSDGDDAGWTPDDL